MGRLDLVMIAVIGRRDLTSVRGGGSAAITLRERAASDTNQLAVSNNRSVV